MKTIVWCAPPLAVLAGIFAGRVFSDAMRRDDTEPQTIAVQDSNEKKPKASQIDSARLSWDVDDPDGMLNVLRQMSPEAAYEALFSLHLEKAGELLAKLVEEHDAVDGESLLRAFLRHPEHFHSYSIASTVFCQAAEDDPALAWREAEAHGLHFLPGMLPALAQGMTRKDPLGAIKHAATIRSPGMREFFTREVIEEWSGRDTTGLLDWLGKQPDAAKLARQVKWGRMEISSAAQLAEIARLMPAEALQNLTDSELLFGKPAENLWIRRTDWLLAMPPGAARENLCHVAAMGLLSIDPEAALALLPAMAQPEVRRQVLTAVAGFRAAASPEEGLAFADSLPDAQERQAARYAAFVTWAENDAPAFTRHAMAGDDPDAKRVLSSAGIRWAMQDPEGAAAFAFENDVPKDDKAAGPFSGMLASAVQTWAGKDPVASASWVNELPRGPQRDRAAAGIALGVAFRFPDEAMIWAQDIADEASRRQTIGLCFSTWLTRQPEQAAQWLAAAQMDDTTRQRLSTVLQNRRGRPYSGSMQNISQGIIVIH
ncbi:MAG: hypothetical protein HS117_16940 [Verrucomicrobiaceae bacterium]|nr:hypothetical protein [Verrucomicrobiaceae bacterium]